MLRTLENRDDGYEHVRWHLHAPIYADVLLWSIEIPRVCHCLRASREPECGETVCMVSWGSHGENPN